jgi:hypothetical protein
MKSINDCLIWNEILNLKENKFQALKLFIESVTSKNLTKNFTIKDNIINRKYNIKEN